MPKVFVSHAAEDRQFVTEEILPLLQSAGLDYWYAPTDINVSTQWEKEILRALRECDWFLVVVSPRSAASQWVKAEVAWAMEHRQGRVISVLQEETVLEDLHLILSTIQYADFRQDRKHGRHQLKKWAEAVRQSCEPARPVVVAVMGAKGGVGKSSITIALAEQIAWKGGCAVIVDSDLETSGVTRYMSQFAASHPQGSTVMDLVYAQRTNPNDPPRTHGLRTWEVTREYIRKAGTGRVYLVPASLDDSRQAYAAMADIDPQRRNAVAASLIEGIVAHVASSLPDVRAVLFDCGAENSPLVSAAVVIADYSYIVSGPNAAFASQIPLAERAHKERFPHRPYSGMSVIVNQATTASRDEWRSVPCAHFVREDARFRREAASGKLDFEGVGPNNFYEDVLTVAHATFSPAHQPALPDPVNVWIERYVRGMKTFPDEMLRSPRYNRWLGIRTAAAVLLMLALLLAGVGYAARPYLLETAPLRMPVSKSADMSNEEFLVKLSAARFGEGQPNGVTLDGAVLLLSRRANPDEIRKEADAVDFGPLRTAMRDGADKLHGQAAGRLSVGGGLGLFALVAGIAAVALWRIRAWQRNLLRRIVDARDHRDPQVLREFLRRIFVEEDRHPRLEWLRNEYRTWGLRQMLTAVVRDI